MKPMSIRNTGFSRGLDQDLGSREPKSMRIHANLDPCYQSGSMPVWIHTANLDPCQYGSMPIWIHANLDPCQSGSIPTGFMSIWIHANLDPCQSGSMPIWIHANLDQCQSGSMPTESMSIWIRANSDPVQIRLSFHMKSFIFYCS